MVKYIKHITESQDGTFIVMAGIAFLTAAAAATSAFVYTDVEASKPESWIGLGCAVAAVFLFAFGAYNAVNNKFSGKTHAVAFATILGVLFSAVWWVITWIRLTESALAASSFHPESPDWYAPAALATAGLLFTATMIYLLFFALSHLNYVHTQGGPERVANI